MDKPTITINGEVKKIKEVKGKDWRVMGEFLEKKISLYDKEFAE